MAKPIANLDIATSVFNNLFTYVNILADALNNEIITANSTYSNTGNTGTPRHAQLFGSLSANTLIAKDGLRGGNTSSSGNLAITSNVTFTGTGFSSTANSLYTNTQFFTANISANGNLFNILGATLNVSSNVSVTANSFIVKSNTSVTPLSITGNTSATNTSITSTKLNISANVDMVGISHNIIGNVTVNNNVLFVDSINKRVGIGTTSPDANLAIVGNANVSSHVRIGGNITGVGTLSVSNTASIGNTTVTGFINVSSSANIGGTLSVSNTASIGNTTVTGFINVSSSANIGGTLSVSNTASIGNTLSVSGSTTFMTNFVVDVLANTNIGNNSSSRLVYSFPKATYKTGKLLIQATNSGNNQIAEMVVAHDNTTAYLTVYGVVASPITANTESPLGTFSAQINNANVEVSMTQTFSNSSVTVVAQLIK